MTAKNISIDVPSQLQAQINNIFTKQLQTAAGVTSSSNSSPSELLLRRQTTKWLQAAKSAPKKMIERSQSQVLHLYLLINLNKYFDLLLIHCCRLANINVGHVFFSSPLVSVDSIG